MKLDNKDVGEVLDRMQSLAEHLDPTWDEDAVQDAWVSVLRSRSSLTTSLGALMPTAILRSLQKILRRETTRVEHEQAFPAERAEPSTDEVVGRLEVTGELYRLVGELPPDFSDTLRLHYFEGLSFVEIAKRKGLVEATVRSHHRRGIAVMRDRMADDQQRGRRDWMSALVMIAPFERETAAVSSVTVLTSAAAWVAVAVGAIWGGSVIWRHLSEPVHLPTAPIEVSGSARDGTGHQAPSSTKRVEGAGNSASASQAGATRGQREEALPSASDLAPDGEWFEFRIRDARTGRQLSNVTVLTSDSTEKLLRYPLPKRDFDELATGLDSPIRTRFDATEGVRWIRAAGAQDAIRFEPDTPSASRAIFFFGVPGYAWGRFELSHSARGHVTVDLTESTQLEVEVVGDLDVPDLQLCLRHPDEVDGDLPELRVPLRTEVLGPLVIDGLEARDWIATVEGVLDEQHREMARARCSTHPDVRAKVRLDLDPAMGFDEGLSLVGTLTTLGAPAGDRLRVQLVRADELDGSLVAEGTVYHDATLDLVASRPGSREYRWTVSELAPGSYIARIRPYFEFQPVEVTSGAQPHLRVDLTDRVSVRIECHRSSDGRSLPLTRVKWRIPTSFQGVPHEIANAGPEGHVRLLLPQGSCELNLAAWTPQEFRDLHESGLSIASSWTSHLVTTTTESLRVPVETSCGLVVVVRERGGPELRVDPIEMGLLVEPVDCAGRIVTDRLRHIGVCELSTPGRYRISFDKFGAYGQIEAREVDVVLGEYARVEFEAVPE